MTALSLEPSPVSRWTSSSEWCSINYTAANLTFFYLLCTIEHVSKVVSIKNDDWFFIKSGATGYVMDLEAGWITSPTDPGAYISMKKQRSLDDADKSLLERQLWRYEDGYFINRRTNYVIDIYGRSAIVGVKLIQQHKATTEVSETSISIAILDSKTC